MVVYCSFTSCISRTPPKSINDKPISFYRFPKSPILIQQWTKAINRDNWHPTKYSRVCELHFTVDMFEQSGWSSVRKLKVDAVPITFTLKNDEKEIETLKTCHICRKHEGLTGLLDVVNIDSQAMTLSNLISYSTGLMILASNDFVCCECLEEAKVSYVFKKKVEISEKNYEMICKSDEIDTIVTKDSIEEAKEDNENVKIDFPRKETKHKNITNCSDVEKTLPKPSITRQHPKAVHSSTSTCTYCNKNLKSPASLRRHVNALHLKTRSNICSYCGKPFYDPANLRLHLRVHTGERPYSCEFCHKRFTQSSHLRSHMLGVHGSTKNYICHCQKSFKLKGELTKHLHSHAGEKPFGCVCLTKHVTIDGLKRHVKALHGCLNDRDEFWCVLCEERFKNVDDLEPHMISKHNYIKHTGEKHDDILPSNHVICALCSQTFNSEQFPAHMIEVHAQLPAKMRTVRPKLYKCECNRTYTTKITLNQHRKNAHSTQTFLCTECGKKFPSITYLRNHAISHSSVRPFVCETCKKSFLRLSDYKQHVRLHTGERPFTCVVCDARFVQRTHLKTHMSTHDGVKRFECETCHKKFGHKSYLAVHRRVHTGETPYSCGCGKVFYDGSAFRKHEKSCRGQIVGLNMEME